MVWTRVECLYQLFYCVVYKHELQYAVLHKSTHFSLSLFFRELAELHKANASRFSKAEEAALSRDVQAKEQLTLALEQVQEEARMQQEALVNQVMRS